MALGQLGRFLDALRRGPCGPDDAAADGRLLDRFAAGNDGAAFAALLRRHAPLVWGVCRRTLGDGPDAEDAFQSTFLVLARKARSVRRRDSVKSWLYGVAARVAVRARQARARRLGLELLARPPTPVGPPDEAARAELRAVLDEEIARLPDRYRVPLVLCYLHGRTNDEAAEELGCPRGTVATRLARARERLRGRLLRRGVALSAGGATLAAPEVVPPSLVAATAEAVAGRVSGPVATLTEGVIRAMYVAKLRAVAAVAISAGILSVGGWKVAALAQPPTAASLAVATTVPAEPAPADRRSERIKELMKERREAASEEYKARNAEFEAGRGTLDQLLESAERLLKAELEMSTTRVARIEARKAHLEHMKEFLRVSTEQFKVGHINVAFFARNRYAALDAEIELEREKAR